jgi:hypothetical protein
MSEENNSWKELEKKIKDLKYISYLYISVGIVLLLVVNCVSSGVRPAILQL